VDNSLQTNPKLSSSERSRATFIKDLTDSNGALEDTKVGSN